MCQQPCGTLHLGLGRNKPIVDQFWSHSQLPMKAGWALTSTQGLPAPFSLLWPLWAPEVETVASQHGGNPGKGSTDMARPFGEGGRAQARSTVYSN